MFKLTKIENGHSGAPEIIKMPKAYDFYIKAGTPLVMSDKVLRPAREDDTKMEYMAFANAAVNDGYVYCYKIYPNMHFEVTCEDPDIKIGDKCYFNSGDEGYHLFAVGVGYTDVCEVTAIDDVARKGTVTVKFICNH